MGKYGTVIEEDMTVKHRDGNVEVVWLSWKYEKAIPLGGNTKCRIIGHTTCSLVNTEGKEYSVASYCSEKEIGGFNKWMGMKLSLAKAIKEANLTGTVWSCLIWEQFLKSFPVPRKPRSENFSSLAPNFYRYTENRFFGKEAKSKEYTITIEPFKVRIEEVIYG